MNSRRVLVGCCFLSAVVDGRTQEDKAAMQKAIRMKTSRQLKEIMTELKIDFKRAKNLDELRKLAYKEDAVGRWEKLHPEKKKPKRSAGGTGGYPGGPGSGYPDYSNMKPPDGMDSQEWARMMAQMSGDFSYERDPERRRILEKLKARGMSFGGGNDMDIEQLRKMEQMIDGINMGNFGAGGGAPPGDDSDEPNDAPPSEEDADVEKMEL
eukprot:CAMPEP_0119321714 /NCGR_PEP_ID=MMETSP1333-20130426/56227_1 /TAXON_ID=418940 /ORGANISM="Scyphosphaera apsteinii, Strain RCC1455" /LENGTH=209 /DNA_ID=CAMNT_0007328749 /DNA_START=58 /DNA_END=687 /DNA_ORIENTATION=-